MIPQREGARYGPGERAHHTFSALERLHVCGTGHCRLRLLCRVLAEGESAPSARKWGIAVNFEMDPPENAQTRSKRDPLRSCGCENARCRPGRSGRLRGGASAGAAEAQSPRRRVQSEPSASQRRRCASPRHSNHVKGQNYTSMKTEVQNAPVLLRRWGKPWEAPPAPSLSQNVSRVPVLAVRRSRAPPI